MHFLHDISISTTLLSQHVCSVTFTKMSLSVMCLFAPLLYIFFSANALDTLKRRCCSSNIASAIFICSTEEAISDFQKHHGNLQQTDTTVGLPALGVCCGFVFFNFD